jgi:MFS family permease
VILGVIAGVWYWLYSSQFEDTDDAYVTGHEHPVSFRVAGTISKVLVDDNQLVKQGQPITGGIAATQDEGSWVSTSYLIGEIITIPLTAWLSRVFSVRWYLIVNVALFLIFSSLCGTARSLGEMIAFRACQGFTGGVMIPIVFAVSSAPMQLYQLREGDWLGIGCMAIGLGSLIAMLEEGQRDDWLGSVFIQMTLS